MSDRKPHAILDEASRVHKARKIESLLSLRPEPETRRLLEVGTGSGSIAEYFATHTTLNLKVTAVDIRDQRLRPGNYEFVEVADTRLPFADASFDIILSNHVIEHVGMREEQRRHLAELHRVLTDGGVIYLAVPNRWMLVEPHYRLAFLSWWPRSWRSAWLRLFQRGAHYDCEPLSLGELDRMLNEARFEVEHLEVEALRSMLQIESHSGLLPRLVAALPDRFLARLRPIIPTLICRLRHAQPAS